MNAVSVRMPALFDVIFNTTEIVAGAIKAINALLKGFLYAFFFLWQTTRIKYEAISAKQ
jgi:hypothetical protein